MSNEAGEIHRAILVSVFICGMNRRNVNYFCNYAWIVKRKPEEEEE